MIARTAHARTFSDHAHYLESDKVEPGASRAAWWHAYNLPSSSITTAARWMERTAERNRLVHRPAYNLFVAVAPGEDAGPRRMRGVAERLLRRLELGEHQAVAVGHEDRRHPHLHLAVNRVHPVTLRAWDATRDWPRIERALREIERDMGFRETPGRLAPTPDGRWCDNARAMPVGARRFELREMEKAERARAAGSEYTPRPSFLRHAREHLAPDVLEAGGWADLEDAAARRGLALLQTGRGLVVTDGVHGAAISRVASGASLHRLTRDFGED
ncbi:MAG TPA: relaxase/mobilization nuclease domain-containing protein, partial [Longimicrobium sp.]|nr:relaxase/mobilization nuclease domain-containing protein [Longimicrobium sp.]